MIVVLLVPFVLQGLAMFGDEFYFHHKRGLPLWEKVGHPVDTFSVLLCYLFLYLQPVNEFNMYVYVGLCAFSCLLITKDEFIHTQLCDAKENWLHAILFVLHPITFLAAGIFWKENLNPTFLLIQPIVLAGFMAYQIIYWSFYAKSK